MAQYLLGIDLGTSSVKAGLLNVHTGILEAFHARQYSEYSEYDSMMLWDRILETLYEVCRKTGGNADIAAIGISGQMHGAVLYDSGGKVIEPLINWRDQKRYDPSVLDLSKSTAQPNDTGANLVAGYTGSILYWMKQHDQENFNRIGHFGLFTDFVRAKLLGQSDHATDPTSAASTGLFDVQSNRWHETLITKLGIPLSIFPMVHRTADIAGVLSESITKKLNLKPGIPVIYGGGDNQMSMLGSGLSSAASPPLINIGTGAQLSKVVSTNYRGGSEIELRPYFDKQYALIGASLGGGGHYQGLRDELQKTHPDIDYIQMNERAAMVPAGSEGLYYCTGPSRSNPKRKKGFFGKEQNLQSVGHQARAVMEGILMDLYDLSIPIGLDNANPNIVGAGKALQVSLIWRQIAADMFGKSLHLTKNVENAVLGAALMAGRGANIFNAPGEWAHVIKSETPINPNSGHSMYYHQHYFAEWKKQVPTLVE